MSLTNREWWTLLHGMIFGALFLLAYAGGLAGLWSLRPHLTTAEGIKERARRLVIGTTAMAIFAWATVVTGTWIVYPWYREKLAGDDLAGCQGLQAPSTTCSPKDFLTSNVSGDTSDWHEFGMEWKEHVAWLAPILASVAAYLVIYYRGDLAYNNRMRKLVMIVLTLSFVTAAVAGLLGALITKTAPIT